MENRWYMKDLAVFIKSKKIEIIEKRPILLIYEHCFKTDSVLIFPSTYNSSEYFLMHFYIIIQTNLHFLEKLLHSSFFHLQKILFYCSNIPQCLLSFKKTHVNLFRECNEYRANSTSECFIPSTPHSFHAQILNRRTLRVFQTHTRARSQSRTHEWNPFHKTSLQ